MSQDPASLPEMDADLLRSGLLPSDMDATADPPGEFGNEVSPSYTFPYYRPDGVVHPRVWRKRLHHPLKGKGKYLGPLKTDIVAAGGEPWEATYPYLYPHILTAAGQSWEMLAKVQGKRVLLVEGEKKAVSAWKYIKRPAIGIPGAYGALWRPEPVLPPDDPAASPTDAGKAKRAAARARQQAASQPFQLHPVLAEILQPGDFLDVVFDADVLTNPDVNRAAGALRQVCAQLGITVCFVLLPVVSAQKMGLDDWIMGVQDKTLVPTLFDALERTDGRGFADHHPTLYQTLGLVMSAKDVPLFNLTNIQCIFDNHPDLKNHIWYDEVSDRMYSTFGGALQQVTEHTGIELTMWMQKRLGLYHFTHGVVTNAMFALMQNQKYTRNHVLDGMTSKWDGVSRLETMFMHGFGAEDTEYHRMVGRMWAVSAIARLLAPGCQVDTMLVLEGDQGIGKSMALQVLGGAGYAALQQKLDNKDFLVTAHTAWIVDMVELGAMKYADMEQIKGLITTRVDSFRSPYGRTSRDRKRRFIMVGTTNSDDYLRDETGNRRFWPVKCNGEIDLAWLEENRDQIWAEARHRYDAGEQWWEDFNAETAEATRAIQNARVADDPWNDVLVTKLNDTTPMRRITWGATLYYFVAGVELLAALGIAVNDMPKYSRRLRAAMRHNKEWTAHFYQSAITPIELTTGGKTLHIRGYIRPVDNVAIMPPPDNVTSLPTSGSKPASKI